jgi:hypothetical protein
MSCGRSPRFRATTRTDPKTTLREFREYFASSYEALGSVFSRLAVLEEGIGFGPLCYPSGQRLSARRTVPSALLGHSAGHCERASDKHFGQGARAKFDFFTVQGTYVNKRLL